MHHRTVIVFNLVVRDNVESVLVEVVGGASLNQIKSDLNVVIAFRGRLHVVEANGVDELVNDCVKPEAANLEVVRLQVQNLATTSSAD